MSVVNGFLGNYFLSLDDKNRVNVPARFRAVLEKEDSPNLVLVLMDNFIIVFPQKEWAINVEKMRNHSAFNREDREEMRQFYARAAECEMKSGKILIPAHQKEIISLTKDVVVAGMSETFEIWSKAEWEKALGANSTPS